MTNSVLFKKKHSYEIENDKHVFKAGFDIRQKKENMEFQHSHNNYEIFFLIDGECDHIIEGRRYKLKPYDIVFLKKGQFHKTIYLKSTNKRLIIEFNRMFLSTSFNEQLDWILSTFDRDVPIFRFNNLERENIFNDINELYNYIFKKDPAVDIMLSNTLLRFLHNIKTTEYKNEYENVNINKDSIMYKMQEVTIFIHNNYHKKLTLSNLSDTFFISKPYLSHKFKEYCQSSLTDYIQLIRIKESQKLLTETNKNITDISALCGFGSISQFNRVFIKSCGLPPREFRSKSN